MVSRTETGDLVYRRGNGTNPEKFQNQNMACVKKDRRLGRNADAVSARTRAVRDELFV